MIQIIEPVLLSETGRATVINLSEGEGDDKKDVKKSLSDIFVELVKAIPEENRFSSEERSESTTTPTGSSKDLSEEDIQKYADENKLSYQDALIELDKQGKLTD